MKIALAQFNAHIGNFEANTQKIIGYIHEAKRQNADLIIFPELSVCGYPPRDFLEFTDFIDRCEHAVNEIATHAEGIAVCVGTPIKNPNIEGKDLYNAVAFLENKMVKHYAKKALLPTYDIFDEYRYFEPNNTFDTVEFKGKRLAITVCEDMWNVGNDNPLYTVCPMDEMMSQNPDLIINCSASPFDYNHAKDRIDVLKANAERYKLPIFYCNQVGAQTDIIFDGGSLVLNSKGVVCDEMPYFQEMLCVYDTDVIEQQKNEIQQQKNKPELIYHALITGIKDYFQKLGFKQAILGLSGGVDSALVTLLAVDALGKENVLPVMMPSVYSSSGSVDDSIQLCKNLSIRYEIIPIKEAVTAFEQTLQKQFEKTVPNVTEENIQARCRAIIVMALSNKFGYILLNTTNKSEAAVGYGTLYGDMCGGLGVLGDVYKTEIYELCSWINRNEERIPKSILTKAPSAELRPNQKDSDSLPEYDILDKVLHQYIEKRKGPRELVEMGFEKALVDRVLKLVNMNEYKREQTPPILRVSIKGFGMGRRMPIVGKYLI